jgi:hypothetical protein
MIFNKTIDTLTARTVDSDVSSHQSCLWYVVGVRKLDFAEIYFAGPTGLQKYLAHKFCRAKVLAHKIVSDPICKLILAYKTVRNKSISGDSGDSGNGSDIGDSGNSGTVVAVLTVVTVNS